MRFYLVWDKQNQEYVTTRHSRGVRTANPRIYATHRHAASACANWVPTDNGEPFYLRGADRRIKRDERGRLTRNPRHRTYDAKERKEKRRELFEIHEYETNTFTVVS